jgi:protein SCO1/2
MRRYLPATALIILLAMVVTACEGAAEAQRTNVKQHSLYANLKGAVLEPPRQLTDFAVPSTVGDFMLSDYRGKVLIVYFGYMACPDVCPTTSAELSWMYDELGDIQDDVQVVFVTVDPERDILDKIQLYLSQFNPDFVGLRTTEDALQSLMHQFGVQATKRQVGESVLSYLMDHTASVFLVDREGRLVEQFLFGTPYQDIAHDIKIVLNVLNRE